jgi:hypothetical protein
MVDVFHPAFVLANHRRSKRTDFQTTHAANIQALQ